MIERSTVRGAFTAIALALLLSLSACGEEEQGTAEKIGEQIDETAKEVQEGASEAVDETGDAIEEGADEASEAMDGSE